MKYYKDICATIFSQHEKSVDYKSAYGKKGLYEQIKQNKYFYSGDQWRGAKVGNKKPLVTHNIIKRIGEYKTAVIGGDDVKISFLPVGVNTEIENEKNINFHDKKVSNAEVVLAAKAVSKYLNTYFKKIHFNDIVCKALKNAYISGCSVVYTYWDPNEKTGLYVDDDRTLEICGDIKSEVIDIENVDFYDPNNTEIDEQEYIIISSRRTVSSLIREAKRNKMPQEMIDKIKPDYAVENEAFYSQKATVLTKFYKDYDKKGNYTIKAIRVCKDAIIKPEWDLKLKRYPISIFNWEENGNVFSESEITNIIPNQIAINRMMTANTWATMLSGMPLMLVNADLVDEAITNEPGQIIRFYGSGEDFDRSIKYITPPDFTGNFSEPIANLIQNTLNVTGATDAALGTIKAQNTSAIESVKESARLPLTLIKKRYLSFIETIASTYLDFILNMYFTRPLIQREKNKTHYFNFDANRYKKYSFYCEANIVSDSQNNIDSLIKEIEELDKHEKEKINQALGGEQQ